MASRRVTGTDIAREVGVSRSTVSLVLNGHLDLRISQATRRRIWEVSRRLGYVPNAAARSLVQRRSETIGVVVVHERTPPFTSLPVFQQGFQGVVAACQRRGFHVLLHAQEAGEPIEPIVTLLRSGRVDGAVVYASGAGWERLPALLGSGIPIAHIGLDTTQANEWVVGFDGERGAELAVAHLLSLGHRRIACIRGRAGRSLTFQGFSAGMTRGERPIDDRLVAVGNWTEEGGRQRTLEILRAQAPPTALFAESDLMAIGALRAARQIGRRVPDDFSIVGFGDIDVSAYVEPPLTTVRVPWREIGERLGGTLLDHLAGEPTVQRRRLPVDLVIRGSAGPAREWAR